MRAGATVRACRAAFQSGCGERGRDHVGDRHEDPDPDEEVLHAAVAAEGDERDDDDRGHGRADLRRDPEQAQGRPDPGELGHRRAEVGDEHGEHREGAPAHPVPLADQAHQPLAGREPEAGAHLLGEEQDDLAGEDDPQQRVAEVRAGQRVGRDPAGVVVGEAADEARAEHRQDRDDADPPGRQATERLEDPDARPDPPPAADAVAGSGRRPRACPPAADEPGRREPAPAVGSAGRPSGRSSLVSQRLKTRGRRFFQAVGMTVSIASSTVTIPTSRRSSSTTGHREQVVVGDDLGDLVLVGQHADDDRLPDHHLRDRGARAARR